MTEQEAMFSKLIDRRYALALQSEIPDFAAYAEEWNKLAADFRALGAYRNVAICESNWKRYRESSGEYIRLVYDTHVELIAVAPAPVREERTME